MSFLIPTEQEILDYLKTVNDWQGPTAIGLALRNHLTPSWASAWASPKCQSLYKKNVLDRNRRGQYRVAYLTPLEVGIPL